MKKHLLLLITFVFFACHKENSKTTEQEINHKEYRIAIVLPTEGEIGAYWKKSIDWSLENLNKALIVQRNIKVSAEWFNEEQSEQELKTLFNTLANRKDIMAIIGPLYAANAKIAAGECYKTNKTLIPATVSSESFMRQYSGKGFLWCLAENDISQCEVLLSRAKQKGAKSVSLLTSDDEYGQTFLDWFAFQAKELNLTIKSIVEYTSDNVLTKMESLLDLETENDHCLICIPNTQEIAIKMNTSRRSRTQGKSFLLFSDIAYIAPKDATFEGMEGITQTYDPESGFSEAYEDKYGDAPSYGSAHYYDAVTLAGLSILHADLTGETNLNNSLMQIVDGGDNEINTCSEAGVREAAASLIAGKFPHCSGASGKLRFDKSVYTNVLHSVYCHWQVYEGKHQILEYNTSDDSMRTDASMANWNWKIAQFPNIDTSFDIVYPPKKELYAMIIATSTGWSNYRYQANAYAMYQLLKKNGVDDDHILLISEDDIANNPQNPRQGFIQSSMSDENLYEGVQVDYRLSQVKFQDLPDVFKSSDSIYPDTYDNLFVYWAGHGEPEGQKWGNDLLSASEMADMFYKLYKKRCYRRVFLAMESSYAGQVGKACENKIPYLFCMTAANEMETSKASVTDPSGQIWISNSFTDNLLRQLISQGDNSTIYDLYKEVYNKTIGSHVSAYNIAQFGFLDRTQTKEFIYP